MNGIFAKYLMISVYLGLFAEMLEASSKPNLWEFGQSLSPLIPPTLNEENLKQSQLGQKLFFDQNLSLNGKVSCASCHIPEKYFTDGKPTGTAIGVGKRNTPTIVNSFAITWSFWDGRADNIASQALKPLEDLAEHGTNRLHAFHLLKNKYLLEYEAVFGKLGNIESKHLNGLPGSKELVFPPKIAKAIAKGKERLKQPGNGKSLASKPLFFSGGLHPQWVKQFSSLSESDQKIVNDSFGNLGLAIAQYERTIVAVNSPFDRFISRWKSPNQKPPLNPEFGKSEFQGFEIFVGKGLCINCHHGPNFTDNQFHNVGFPNENLDFGRAEGMLVMQGDIYNCKRDTYKNEPWIYASEACLEKDYILIDNLETFGAFKTPSLRNVTETAPYGHNGQLATLKDVVKHYAEARFETKIGHRDEALNKVKLSETEQIDLLSFLKALTSSLSIGTK